MPSILRHLSLLVLALALAPAQGQIAQTKNAFEDKFRQLDESWPTPTATRSATGAPGPAYWQQQVDYDIDVHLLEEGRRIEGEARIRYHNNSPEPLAYLWFQMDQNRFRPDSDDSLTRTFGDKDRITYRTLRREQFMADVPGGYDLGAVTDAQGKALPFVVRDTLMRVDLPKPLAPGKETEVRIQWAFNIQETNATGGRAGFEHFAEDGNDIFLLAQWYPRLAAFSDYEGWHNKAFLGNGEFTLEFGNYEVAITVPADHVVASTGVLQNPREVMSDEERARMKAAETAEDPVFIVTAEEALAKEGQRATEERTWRFKAENVRDFAWASSRKFIWDAQGYAQDGEGVAPDRVMAMSFYPKEGEPLWSRYSTESVIHTMEVYSRYSFPYPYPTAQSVNGPVGGMEYPMITFNGPRTELRDDGSRTYSLAEKRFLIGVVIHEVGHIYFPMTVNSDERQWTWMDEGLNSFLDGVAGREWDPTIPWGVEPRDITGYMKSQTQVPIMTQSDSVLRLGPNAYTKPAVALNILRETILGRELFDFAFKEYAQRWMFKRPTPSDFFRTMEEASGVDLDWFWRGWFYTTDHVDISLDSVYKLRLDTEDPDIDFAREREAEMEKPKSLTDLRNKEEGKKLWVERFEDISDFYDENDRYTVTNKERNKYKKFLKDLEPWERKAFERAVKEDKNYYVLDFSNKGGLVMPIILELTFEDGTKEEMRIPAEIWRRTPKAVSKLIVTDKDKELVSVTVDPHWETADVDVENNHYPRRIIPSRIEAYKNKPRNTYEYRDLMHDSKTELKTDDEDKDDE